MSAPRVRVNTRARWRRCYELSIKGQRKDPSWLLCHGTLLARRHAWSEPEHIAHAWLQRGDQVYDSFYDRVFTLAEYPGFVERAFSPQEVAALTATSGHFGPWSEAERERARVHAALLQAD